jgi:hypothetical protein
MEILVNKRRSEKVLNITEEFISRFNFNPNGRNPNPLIGFFYWPIRRGRHRIGGNKKHMEWRRPSANCAQKFRPKCSLRCQIPSYSAFRGNFVYGKDSFELIFYLDDHQQQLEYEFGWE